MILPNKYLSNSESLIGISAYILDTISDFKLSLDELWENFNDSYIKTGKLKFPPTYNKFILTLNFMYITNMVDYNKEGKIFNENIKFKNN